MDFYQRIAQGFQNRIEAIALTVDELAEPLERACIALTQALVSDHKIIACGNGPDVAMAQLLVHQLRFNSVRERPALPAISLSQDVAAVTVGEDESFDTTYSRQLQALGQAGDVLVCICSGQAHRNLERAIQSAHQRNMSVILLSTSAEGSLMNLLEAEDTALLVDSAQQTLTLELHTMVVHSLCELIDEHLFGAITGTP